ncbi:hypothetical protein Tco_1311019 [Tanacetum coccineum]
MSTQQDIYAAESKNRPPRLNKYNYVTWSSCLSSSYERVIQTVKVLIAERTCLEQNDDIYAAVDSCETAQEIWLRVQQMMKGSDIGIQDKKAKLFNEWERFTSTNGESFKSCYHHFLKLMNDFKRNKHSPEKIASNLKFLNNLQPEWRRHVTIVHQIKNLYEVDYTQLYDFLKYNQAKVNELRVERLAIAHDPLALMANFNNPYNYTVFHQDQPSPVTYMQQPQPNNNFIPQPSFNTNYMKQPMPNPEDITDPITTMTMALVLMAKGHSNNTLIVVLGIANLNANLIRNGNVVAARAEGMLLIAQKEEAGIQLQAKEFDFMAAVGDLDEIEEVNANCILMANLQQASTSGTHIDKAPIHDSDGSAKYTDLHKPIPEPHQVQQNDSDVISAVSSGGTVEQNPATVEETCALYDSLYNNLAIEVEKVNMVSKEKSTVSSLQEEKKMLKSNFRIRKYELLDKQIHLEIKIKELDNILVKMRQSIQTMHMLSPQTDSFYHTEQKMALEADESLAKHKALEFEIERLLRVVVSQDIMSIVQSYNDMQQKIKWLQDQLGDIKGKSKDTQCESDTLDSLSQKLEKENMELEFQVLNYAKDNAHIKTTYKNLFDSINVTRAQTKTTTDSLQQKLHDTIYENDKLRPQLFDKVSEQKDITKSMSVNTKFANQSTERKPSLKSLRNNFVVRQTNAFQSER